MNFKFVEKIDPEVAKLIHTEIKRQEEGLELIASENFVSRAVLEALGSPLTNKYAEGYPGRRYYGGCEYYDQIETIAIERAKELFGVEYANVQPHSGAQANMAVYFAFLKPGDTILTMELAHGGHLSHGSPVNSSGKLYNAVHYRVDPESHLIDYDHAREQALKYQPKLIVCGASAYPRYIDFKKFREIADEVGAILMADIAHIAGLVAAGLHPDPAPYCDVITSTTHKTLRGPRGGLILSKKDYQKKLNSALFPGTQGGPLMHVIAAKAVAFKEALQEEFKTYQQQIVKNAKVLAEELASKGIKLVSGGTDNHMVLLDVGSLGLTGKQCEEALEKAGITVNKNMIPYDPHPPRVTSGIRLGTPAVTTRGMKEPEMKQIAEWIFQVFESPDDEEKLAKIKGEVLELTKKFPIYKDLI